MFTVTTDFTIGCDDTDETSGFDSECQGLTETGNSSESCSSLTETDGFILCDSTSTFCSSVIKPTFVLGCTQQL